MNRKRLATVIAGIMIFSMALTGCGNKGDNAAQNTTDKNNKSKVEEKTETEKQKEEEKLAAKESNKEIIAYEAENPDSNPVNRDDTIIIGIEKPNGIMTPGYSTSSYDWAVTGIMFDDLVGTDLAGQPAPNGVAKSWEYSKDGKTLTFNLRDDIKCWDGKPLTAKDVAFTYTLTCDSSYEGKWDMVSTGLVGAEEYNKGEADKVEGIKVIDDYTISLTFKEVNAQAIYDVSIKVLPEHYYGKDYKQGHTEYMEALHHDPLGYGAYKFQNLKEGQEISFVSNPDYFKGAPKIKNVIYKYTENDTRLALLLNGEVDFSADIDVSLDNIEEARGAGFLDIGITPNPGYGYIGFNCARTKFSDKRVRQALTYGLNRHDIIENVYGDNGFVLNVPQVTVAPSYPGKDNLNTYEYNPEKAKQLLDEAGWKMGDDGFRHKDGEKLSIKYLAILPHSVNEIIIPMAEINYKDIGVEFITEGTDFNTLCDKVQGKAHDYDAFFLAYGINPDPNPESVYASWGVQNDYGYKNDKLDSLIKGAKKELDETKRNEMWKECFQIINEDLPLMFMYQRKNMIISNHRFQGFEYGIYHDWYTDLYKVEIVK
jgi:peptide/nickel transport system substrate-binding protein